MFTNEVWSTRESNGDYDSQSDMNNTKRQYEALTPKNDIKNGQEYMAAFAWALSKPNIP